MRASAIRKKLSISVYLKKNRAILTYFNFILRKFALFVLALDPIENVFLYFDLYGHGKLDCEFVHGRAEKCVGSNKICPKRCTYQEAEIAEENNRTMSFGVKGLFICRHIYLCKQLLPQIISCYQEVMQNNEMISPWSNHCWMLVASIKMTTR